MTGSLHDDELPIDAALVRRLVDDALPEYADRSLVALGASGSSNALYRLVGADRDDDLLVRLPRQPGGSTEVDKEARWLPHVAPYLPVPAPEVVAVGQPGHGYPERWSVVRWLEGKVPRAPTFGAALGEDLADLVAALGAIDVPAAAVSDPALRWYRGDPLPARDAQLRADLAACRNLSGLDLDLAAVGAVWDAVLALPPSRQVEQRWLHGDLLAENLLVRRGRLVGVLDFGGLSVGDPTVDLVGAWEVLDAAGREAFRRRLDLDDETWLRGAGWALVIAVMTFPYYWRTMPRRCADRLAMARAVMQELGGRYGHSADRPPTPDQGGQSVALPPPARPIGRVT